MCYIQENEKSLTDYIFSYLFAKKHKNVNAQFKYW